jgi:Tol biopolymer transport system component
MKKFSIVIGIVLLVVLVAGFLKSKKTKVSLPLATAPSGTMPGITTLKDSGGMVDWSYSGNDLIAFDAPGSNGYYDVYTMTPDGRNETCITCGVMPRKRHHGGPAWHPSGKYIAFISEKEGHPGSSYVSLPGFGGYDDLWVITADGKHPYLLQSVPVGRDYGIIMPHFSYDGTMISWNELYKAGNILTGDLGLWKLKTARFSDEGGIPHISDIREYQPGEPAFYENHGFSPDGTKLIFTSNFKTSVKALLHNNIYVMNLSDGTAVPLTSLGYNEHATYSPDGKRIVWMTNNENPKTSGLFNKGTDWWLMNADGSNKRRLTSFNIPGNPEYQGKNAWATRISWSPDGSRFVGYIQDDLVKQTGKIVMVNLGKN